MRDGHLGRMATARHFIEPANNDDRLVNSAPCRAGPRAKQFAATENDRMLQKDLTEPGTPARASSVLFASNKDRSLWFCVDYRKFKALKIRDSYPQTRMEGCIDLLEEGKIFST